MAKNTTKTITSVEDVAKINFGDSYIIDVLPTNTESEGHLDDVMQAQGDYAELLKEIEEALVERFQRQD